MNTLDEFQVVKRGTVTVEYEILRDRGTGGYCWVLGDFDECRHEFDTPEEAEKEVRNYFD